VKLLLDTHVVLWALADPGQLSAEARSRIADPANTVAVSAASAWEIAIKIAAGRLKFDGDFGQALADADFLALPITVEHALTAGGLPPHHGDPFDRMLVAQSMVDGWTLVTRDRVLPAYGVPLLLA
jgi:PIN domain nuclease of toxin-antitoxin system